MYLRIAKQYQFFLLGLPLIAIPTLSKAQVNPEIHNLCVAAKDYLGCVKAMKGDSTSSERQTVDIDMIRSTGNRCPSTMAYTGAGYCEKVICIPNYRGHDYRLGGKGWSCKGGMTLQFTGTPIRATTDERCSLTEPEIGKNNSCQNGLSEDEINKGYGITEQKAQRKTSFGFRLEGVEGERVIKVADVIPGCAFAKAGLIKGDKIESLNGRTFSLGSYSQADSDYLGSFASNAKTASIVYLRDGVSNQVSVKPSMCSFPSVKVKFNNLTGKSELLD